MRIPKAGKLLLGGIIVILLSVLALTQAGGFCHAQTPFYQYNPLQEGIRLFSNQEVEKAYRKFDVARTIALTIEHNTGRALQATKCMAQCLYIMGYCDSCIYYYKKAAELAIRLNDVYEQFDIYTSMQQAYQVNVDMENALYMSQKIDSLISVSSDERLQISALEKLAREALGQQNLDLAEHYLLDCEVLLGKLGYRDRILLGYLVYSALQDFYTAKKDFEKAIKFSRLYIETSKVGLGNTPMAYMSYGREALVYAYQKNKEKAFADLDTMKTGIWKYGETNLSAKLQYYEIEGNIHGMFEEWGAACHSYKNGLALVEGTYVKYRDAYFRNHLKLGTALYHLKKNDEARDCFANYTSYCKKKYGENSMVYADALWSLANFEGLSGKPEIGKAYFTQSVDINKKTVIDQLHYVSVQERDAFWYSFAPKMWHMISYALKAGEQNTTFTEKSYEALLFSKALLLESDRAMAVAIHAECNQEEQKIYQEMVALQNRLKALSNDYEKNKVEIDELHQKISQQNRVLTPIISKLGYNTFLTMGYENVRQLLDDEEILLDFTDFETDERIHQYVAFVINKEQKHPKMVKAFTEEDISKTLQGKPIVWLYIEPFASKIRSKVWSSLSKAVKGKKTIYYVPSGLMHQISLESIPTEDGTLLGEHYHFVRLTSAREIDRIKHQPSIKKSITATVYGALKYDVDTWVMANEAKQYETEPLLAMNKKRTVTGNGKRDELPNTKTEVEKIKEVLNQSHVRVTMRTGIKGTEESFLAMSGKAPNILHVATHGFYYTPEKAMDIDYLKGYQDAMMLSGLIMSGGNRAWTGQKIPKGVLGGVMTANEIACMDLKGTDLLVLSACQTGLGVATSEGLYGLQRAFKKAGVQTLIMALWEVSDVASKDFMIKFYEELVNKENGWDKRKAFNNAIVHMKNDSRYRDPYYWAGFIMLD